MMQQSDAPLEVIDLARAAIGDQAMIAVLINIQSSLDVKYHRKRWCLTFQHPDEDETSVTVAHTATGYRVTDIYDRYGEDEDDG
jgi:hypothetical protein